MDLSVILQRCYRSDSTVDKLGSEELIKPELGCRWLRLDKRRDEPVNVVAAQTAVKL